jgi:hypothetical protein
METKYCQIILKELRETYWKALTIPGNWIYTTIKPETIRVDCLHTKQVEINNSGIISIRQGCKIKAGTTTMSHPSVRTMEFTQHYTPTNNLSILQLYEPIREKYQVDFKETAHELWTINNSHVEMTFDDIIAKAREIKDRRAQEQRLITYSAAGCGMGVLGIFIVIIWLINRNSWISNTANLLYLRCCRDKGIKGPTPCPSVDNKNRDIEAQDAQSSQSEAQAVIETSQQ